MEEFVIKNRKHIIKCLSLVMAFMLVASPLFVIAQEDLEEGDDITVGAVVQAWLNFTIDTTIDLGELVTAAGETVIGSDTADISIGTNSATGWTVQIESLNSGKLVGTEDSNQHEITFAWSAENTATVSKGADFYGVVIAEEIANVTVPARFEKGAQDYIEEAQIGQIEQQAVTLISKNSPNADGKVAQLEVYASALPATPSDSYSDTITLTASVPVI